LFTAAEAGTASSARRTVDANVFVNADMIHLKI
jgi:hypothetical protein